MVNESQAHVILPADIISYSVVDIPKALIIVFNLIRGKRFVDMPSTNVGPINLIIQMGQVELTLPSRILITKSLIFILPTI